MTTDPYTDPNATFADHLRESATGLLNHLRTWFDNGYAPNDWEAADLADFWEWVGDNAARFHYTTGWQRLATVFARETMS